MIYGCRYFIRATVSANEAKIGTKEDFLPEKIFSYLKRYRALNFIIS
jgi:hypothetical protein